MTDPAVVATVLLAASALLPARPAAAVAADVDRDGTPELALLLVWDDWATLTRDVSAEPGVSEIDVVPAIRERREIRVLEVVDGLPAAAAPLAVGREVLALDAGSPAGDAFVLTDDGPARLVLAGGAADRAVRLEPVAEVAPAFRGAERVYSFLAFVHDPGPFGGSEVFVPVDDGIAVVGRDGAVRRLVAPLLETRSGRAGSRRYTFPQPLRLRGGAGGLLDVTRQAGAWHEPGVAWRPIGAEGTVGPPEAWSLGALLRLTPEERSARRIRTLADVADLDDDGTLEAAVAVVDSGAATSLKGALETIRGMPGRIDLYALRRGGRLDDAPESSIAIEGHLFPLPRRSGVRTPFRDLDGDGRPELVTFTVSIGVFGAGRAVVTGNAKARLHPVVHRRGPDGAWSPVEDAVPSLVFRQNLRKLDLSRFFDWPGDLDGDGIVDLVEVDGREIRVRLGREGPSYRADPATTVRLDDPIASWGGVRFDDLDADGDLDMLAFTPVEARRGETADPLARPTRLEIRLFEGFDR